MPLLTGPYFLAPQVFTTHADITVSATTLTLILAANPVRTSAFIANVGSNPARIGDNNTGAARGLVLTNGTSLTLDTTDAIYCYSTSGSTIAANELVRP